MSEGKILIVSGCKYPEGDAGSVRIHALAKLFESCGKQSVVIGKGKKTTADRNCYDGVEYFSFRKNDQGLFGKIKDRFGYEFLLDDYLQAHGREYSHILIVDVPFRAIRKTIKFAQKNEIQLLHDSLEWYSPSEFKLGVLDPMYRHRDQLNRKIINQDFKVIVISKYLENYFAGKGCRTIRIPAILTTNTKRKAHPITDKRIITYAGLPEKKDKLVEILDAFADLPLDEKNSLELRIIGITLEQLQKKFKLSDEKVKRYKNGILFYGRVSRDEVLRKLDETHFTIFYRDATERYAKAGFPTKVAESTSKGIPVITNHSSDLADYLIDGVNSIVISDEVTGIKDAFKKACTISNEQYENLANAARNTYRDSFCFDVYTDAMNDFLEQ